MSEHSWWYVTHLKYAKNFSLKIYIFTGFTCTCPPDYDGDPYHGLCSPAYKRCTADNECGTNEKCVQPGECICPPPFFVDAGNACTNPCERFLCGINAKCTPTNRKIFQIICLKL